MKNNIYFLFIFILINYVFPSENQIFYSKNDSIIVSVNDISDSLKIVKSYEFCFISDPDSLHTLKFTLWKTTQSDMVYCSLNPKINYLLKNDIIAKLNDIVMFYLSDHYNEKSWNSYDGFIRLKDYYKRYSDLPFVGLEMKEICLLKITTMKSTKLYHFEVKGNSHIIEGYVFDDHLNLYQFSFRNVMDNNGTSTYSLKRANTGIK